MVTLGLDKNMDFFGECSGLFEMLSKAYVQLEKDKEVDISKVSYLEHDLLYFIQFKHLTPNEELIREQIINAIKSLLDLHYMISSLNPNKIDKKKNKSAILEILQDLAKEYNDIVPIDVILKEMEKKYNLSKDDTKKVINKLKEQGLIFEPKIGYLKEV